MTVGISTTNLAHRILDHLRGGTAWTQPTGLHVQLHTADPGASGTTGVFANVSTARSQATFSAAASGSINLSNSPSWTITGAGGTVTHIAVFDAASAGNFLWSAALSASKTVASGDTLTLTTCQLTLGTLAA